jgi:hypothetical protein
MRRLSLLLLAACTARAPSPRAVPDYRPIVSEPAPPRAALIAGCIGDAVARAHYRRATDPSTTLLLFTCTGAPAKAFFDGLAAWSARKGSQFEHQGRTFRSTARAREDLFGVDWCATDGTSYECVITLNVGDFIR